MGRLELTDLINLNKAICLKTREPFGILNKSALLSALSIQDNNYYSSRHLMICALLRSLVLSHGFIQGNKRVAFLSIVLLDFPKCSTDELADVILHIADGSIRDVEQINKLIYGE